jgi:hypothetical protein
MYSCFVVNISRKSLLVDTCITHTDYKYASKFLFLLFLLFPFAFSTTKKTNVLLKKIGQKNASDGYLLLLRSSLLHHTLTARARRTIETLKYNKRV